jgi:hypothetical protein
MVKGTLLGAALMLAACQSGEAPSDASPPEATVSLPSNPTASASPTTHNLFGTLRVVPPAVCLSLGDQVLVKDASGKIVGTGVLFPNKPGTEWTFSAPESDFYTISVEDFETTLARTELEASGWRRTSELLNCG